MKAGRDYIGVGLGALILNKKNEVLLTKRGRNAKNECGAWALVGGALDFGETLEQGITREVFEEINVKIKIEKQIPSYDHILKNENQHWVATVFIAHITKGTPKIMEEDKCEKIEWFPINKLPSPIAQMSKPALEYLKKNIK